MTNSQHSMSPIRARVKTHRTLHVCGLILLALAAVDATNRMMPGVPSTAHPLFGKIDERLAEFEIRKSDRLPFDLQSS